MRSLARLLNADKPAQKPPPEFDLGMMNADADVATLAERLVASGERRFSLCLQGPPGSGKSAFALRRFTFKIALGYLTADQAAHAFRGYFDAPPPEGLARMALLTPADFAVVRRRAELLACLDDTEGLLRMLGEGGVLRCAVLAGRATPPALSRSAPREGAPDGVTNGGWLLPVRLVAQVAACALLMLVLESLPEQRVLDAVGDELPGV